MVFFALEVVEGAIFIIEVNVVQVSRTSTSSKVIVGPMCQVKIVNFV